MTKKILVMVFFWASFIGFFYMLLVKELPPGTTLHIQNTNINIILKFAGVILFSAIIAFYIGATYKFLTNKDSK